MARKKKREKNKRIGDKVRVLRHEGKSEEAALGEAYGMERAGRLRKGGRYVHVSRSSRAKKRKGRRSSRA